MYQHTFSLIHQNDLFSLTAPAPRKEENQPGFGAQIQAKHFTLKLLPFLLTLFSFPSMSLLPFHVLLRAPTSALLASVPL